MHKTGLLLTNLGTPDSTSVPDVRRYLRQFLGDHRVIDMNPVGKFFLLNMIILPLRPRKSAHAYQQVWTERGSPLMFHSTDLRDAVRAKLGPSTPVALGMRYGNPSIESAAEELVKQDVTRIVLVPLYPQYAASTVASTLDEVTRVLGKRWASPALTVVPPFYDDARFIRAVTEVSAPLLEGARAEHVLMSFHGLPVRHVQKCDPTGSHCRNADACCDAIGSANLHCYRAQCLATARGIAEALGLSTDRWTMSFQSRLGRDPWLGPDTEHVVQELGKKGVKRLAVMCPSFVADCLETIEEIGMRGRELFMAAGGEAYTVVPCVNASAPWVDALVEMVRPHLEVPAGAASPLLAQLSSPA